MGEGKGDTKRNKLRLVWEREKVAEEASEKWWSKKYPNNVTLHRFIVPIIFVICS